MREMKRNFASGKMNKDLDERIVPAGQYRDAMNIQVATTEGSDVGTMQNILGNILVDGQSQYQGFIPPNSICVGSVADEKNDKLYWFVHQSTDTSKPYNFIVEYDFQNDLVTPIFVDTYGTACLNFNPSTLITGVNIIDGMLFWTDGYYNTLDNNKFEGSEPKKINIERCRQGTDIAGNVHTKLVNESLGYGPSPGIEIDMLEEHITVIKKRPSTPLKYTAKTGRDDDRFYTGIVKIVADPQGAPNESSFMAGSSDHFDFSGFSVGDEFAIRIEGAVRGDGTVVWSPGNTPWNLAAPLGGVGWAIGSKVVLEAFEEPAGNMPALPLTDFSIKGKIVDWNYTHFDYNPVGVNPPEDVDPNDWRCQVKIKVVGIDGFPEPAIGPLFERYYVVDLFDETEKLFEFKFPRFSYRYKYEDGEYSAFAPWTDVVFSPGSFDYHPRKGYNLAMVNRIKEIDLEHFVTNDIPDDVVAIDILYKDDRAPIVYVVDTVRPDDEFTLDSLGLQVPYNNIPAPTHNAWTLRDSTVTANNPLVEMSPQGRYTVTDETVSSAVAENQMLRSFDNVPKKALAQDITGNRIVYANYLQNYDLKSGATTKSYNPILRPSLIDWHSVGVTTKAIKSIKSLREYQLGVVFVDEYGRETPVLSNSSGTIKVEKDKGDKYNRIEVGLEGDQFPYNMKYFKFFVKETATEYYNMAMDRWYDAEDGNIWLAFPSSDRNKIDIDTFLILKKGTDSDSLVTEAARYKVLAIEAQAPDYIKTEKYVIEEIAHYVDTDDTHTKDIFGVTMNNSPGVGVDHFLMKYQNFYASSGASLHKIYQGSENATLYIEFGMLGDPTRSDRYRITEITCDLDENNVSDTLASSNYYVKLDRELGDDVNFITDDPTGLTSTMINDGATVTIYKYVVENSPKFDGRFFVKIYKDDIFQQHIKKSFVGEVKYRKIDSKQLFSTVRDHYEILFNKKTGVGLNDYGTTGPIGGHCNGDGTTGHTWGPWENVPVDPQMNWYPIGPICDVFSSTACYQSPGDWYAGTASRTFTSLSDVFYPHGMYSTPHPSGYTEFAAWAVYFRKYGKKVSGELWGEKGSHYKRVKCFGSNSDDCHGSPKHSGGTVPDFHISSDGCLASGTDWTWWPAPQCDLELWQDEYAYIIGPHLVASHNARDNAGNFHSDNQWEWYPSSMGSFNYWRFPNCHKYHYNRSNLGHDGHVDAHTRDWEVWFVDGGPYLGHKKTNTLIGWNITTSATSVEMPGMTYPHDDYGNIPLHLKAEKTRYGKGIMTNSVEDFWTMDIGFGGILGPATEDESYFGGGDGLRDLWGHGSYNVPGTGTYEDVFNLGGWDQMATGQNSFYKVPDFVDFVQKINPGYSIRWRQDPTGPGGQGTKYDIAGRVNAKSLWRYAVGNNCQHDAYLIDANNQDLYDKYSTTPHGQNGGKPYQIVGHCGKGGNFNWSNDHSGPFRGDHFGPWHRDWRNNGVGFTCNFSKVWQPSIIRPNIVWNPYSSTGTGWISNGLDLRLTQSKKNNLYVFSQTNFEPIEIYVQTIRGTCETNGVQRDVHPGMALVQGTNANGTSGTLEDLPGNGTAPPPKQWVDNGDFGNDLLLVIDVADEPVAGIDGVNGASDSGYWIKLIGCNLPMSAKDRALQGESGGVWRFVQPKLNGLSPNAADTISAHSGLIGAVSYDLEWVEDIEPEEIISENPAIFETEPKESADLDIYFEASGYIPTILDAETIKTAIPIGSRVSHKDDTNTSIPVPTYSVGTTGTNSIILDSQIDFSTIPTPVTLSGGDILIVETPYNLSFEVTVVNITYIDTVNSTTAIELDTLLYNNFFCLPWHNCYSFGNGVESNRIRDNFNLPYISNGVKASTTLEEEYKEEHRKYGLIYSGIYNSITGVNNLNQFIQAEKITKDVNPIYGSIQKLHSRDTDLVTLCEDKILKILANKDALYNADGDKNVTATENVLGQTWPFDGEYGISTNPESFASESYRAYFTDKVRGAVLRLSKDGLTPISDHGMRQWFKQNLRLGENLIGSYDDKKDQYNITIEAPTSYTLTFKETVRGWVSFKSFIPEYAISMANNYYSFSLGKLWRHHDESMFRNTFYCPPDRDCDPHFTPSSFKVIINEAPDAIKSFNTVTYTGSQAKVEKFEEHNINGADYSDQEYYNMVAKDGWWVQNITTDKGGPNEQDGKIDEFIEKEGLWHNYIRGIEVPSTLLGYEPVTEEFSFQGIGLADVVPCECTTDCDSSIPVFPGPTSSAGLGNYPSNPLDDLNWSDYQDWLIHIFSPGNHQLNFTQLGVVGPDINGEYRYPNGWSYIYPVGELASTMTPSGPGTIRMCHTPECIIQNLITDYGLNLTLTSTWADIKAEILNTNGSWPEPTSFPTSAGWQPLPSNDWYSPWWNGGFTWTNCCCPVDPDPPRWRCNNSLGQCEQLQPGDAGYNAAPYTNLDDCELACNPPLPDRFICQETVGAGWACDSIPSTHPDYATAHTTMAACLADTSNNCQAPSPSWCCDSNGDCIDPGNGTGAYSTLAACDNRVVGGCTDPLACNYDPCATYDAATNATGACQYDCDDTNVITALTSGGIGTDQYDMAVSTTNNTSAGSWYSSGYAHANILTLFAGPSGFTNNESAITILISHYGKDQDLRYFKYKKQGQWNHSLRWRHLDLDGYSNFISNGVEPVKLFYKYRDYIDYAVQVVQALGDPIGTTDLGMTGLLNAVPVSQLLISPTYSNVNHGIGYAMRVYDNDGYNLNWTSVGMMILDAIHHRRDHSTTNPYDYLPAPSWAIDPQSYQGGVDKTHSKICGPCPTVSNTCGPVAISARIAALPIYGCTSPTAYNYDPLANTDDGSCCYTGGCTNTLARNYDPSACYDDGTCVYARKIDIPVEVTEPITPLTPDTVVYGAVTEGSAQASEDAPGGGGDSDSDTGGEGGEGSDSGGGGEYGD